MATFYNQATLSFGGNQINSNVTTGEIVSGLSITKNAITTDYGPGDSITYAITLVNSENTAVGGISLTDNLGIYTVPGGTLEVVPLTYVDGSVLYYQNGVLQAAPTVVSGPPLVFSGITVPASGNVIILYEVRANSFAPLSEDSGIYNTVTLTGGELCEELSASATVQTRNEPILSITKSVYPAVINCNGEITYTIIIQNTGNTAVVATDNLVVNDTFNPILSDVTVTLNGTTLTEGTDYTYNETTGDFSLLVTNVPAATYSRDPNTGVVTTTPGIATITVAGVVS